MANSGAEEGYDDSKKYEDLQEKVLSYLCQGLSPPEVQANIKDEYLVALSLQHISKLNSLLVANREDHVFAQCAAYLKNEYGAVSDLLDSPACIFYQDETMKNTFARFPHIIYLAVSRTFCKQTVITVSCQDSFGKIEVVAAGILNHEDKSTFSWFLEVFKRHNESSEGIRVVVLATNVSRFKIVKQLIPDAYLFIHDPLAAFANDLRDLNINFSEKEVKSLLYKFQDLMNTDNKKDYNKEVMELRKIAQKEVFSLFMRSWDPFEIHWVYGSQNNVAKFLSRAGKAFTSVMNVIGGLGQKQFSGLNAFVKAYHACVVKVRETRAEAVKTMMASFDEVVQRHASHAVSQRVYKHLTPVAADAVLEQYNRSVSARVQNIVSGGNYQWCECPFYKILNLPCIHIFIKKRKEKSQLFEESECNKLWTWKYCQQNASRTNAPVKRKGVSDKVTKSPVARKTKPEVDESDEEDDPDQGVEDEEMGEEMEIQDEVKEEIEEGGIEDNSADDAPPIDEDENASRYLDLQGKSADYESSDDELMVAENLEEDSLSSNEEESGEDSVAKPAASPKKSSRKNYNDGPEESAGTLYQHFTVALDITACLATVLSRSDHSIFEERIGDLHNISRKWEMAEDEDVLKTFDIADFQKAYEAAPNEASSLKKNTHQYVDALHKNFSRALRITSRIAKFLARSNPSIFKQRLADLLSVLRKWRKCEESGIQKKVSVSSAKTTRPGPASKKAVNNVSVPTGPKEFGLRKRKVIAHQIEAPGPRSRKRYDYDDDYEPKEPKRRKIGAEEKVASSKAKTVVVEKALKQSHLSKLSSNQKKQLLMEPSIELQSINLDCVKEEEDPELKEKLELCGWMVSYRS